ncbi:MAG: ROK family protein, partial [Acidimicrobiia bacterium]
MGIAIGIDLGGSKLAAGLVAPDATVKSFTVSPRPADPDTMVTEPLRVVAALKSSDVVAVGVGIGGLVADGVLTWGPNIPGEGIDYSQAIESAVELPVIVDNEVNLAAYAEAVSGAAVGFASVLMVTIGTGIGAGIVIDGRIYRGAGYAGEAGHINVHPGGRRCSCGQQGCWEAYASGRRLDELARTEARTHPAGMVARLAGGRYAAGEHALT